MIQCKNRLQAKYEATTQTSSTLKHGLTPIKHIDPLYINNFHFRLLSSRIHTLLSPPTLCFAKNAKSWKPISSTKMSENASKRRAFSSAWGGSRCAWAVTEMDGCAFGNAFWFNQNSVKWCVYENERERERERELQVPNVWPLTHPCPVLYTRNGLADGFICFGVHREHLVDIRWLLTSREITCQHVHECEHKSV